MSDSIGDPASNTTLALAAVLGAFDERVKRFVCEIARGTGKSEAARRAGYSNRGAAAGVAANRLLKRQDVREAVAAVAAIPVMQPAIVAEIKAAKQAKADLAQAADIDLALSTRVSRAEVLDAMRKIMLGLETETRYTKNGEPYEVRPPAAARVAAGAAIRAMEGYDAPVKLGGKIDHAHDHTHAHTHAFTREEIAAMPTDELRRRVLEAKNATN